MRCTQQRQLVCFPKVRVMKAWFRHFNNHKEFQNEGTLHLFSLMALYSYANFRSNTRTIGSKQYMEAPGQWICKLGALPRILRLKCKAQALEQMKWLTERGFISFEFLDEEQEMVRFAITDWTKHCTHLEYNYYSYTGTGFFFFPLSVGRQLIAASRREGKLIFSELDAIMDLWLHTVINEPAVPGSEYMPVVYFPDIGRMPLLSYTFLAKRWGWSKSRVGRFMLKAGEYGVISRVSFSGSRGSVISICRYREMIYGEDCEELQLRMIGELLGLHDAIRGERLKQEDITISVETRVPPKTGMPNAGKSVKIQVFRAVASSFFARQIPLIFYSVLDWRVTNREAGLRSPPSTESHRE